MFKANVDQSGQARLVADAVLSPDDFRAIADEIGATPFVARKAGLLSARVCYEPEVIETRWNGRETVNSANPFDYIVTSLDRTGQPLVDGEGHQNVYVIAAGRFHELYKQTKLPGAAEPVYRSTAIVQALYLARGFEIRAPWGEAQVAPRGYLICNPPDVYGNNAETFESSYDHDPTA